MRRGSDENKRNAGGAWHRRVAGVEDAGIVRMRMVRWSWVGVGWIVGFLLSAGGASAATNGSLYAERLRQAGYADWAIEYLQLQLQRQDLRSDQRADLELELATSLLAGAESLGDLSRRGQMLTDARSRLDGFVRKYPDHERSAEAAMQLATVDLQQGQIAILQAQLPANAVQSLELAKQGRDLFEKAIAGYKTAAEKLKAAHAAMPIFIPEEETEERRKKSRLFEQYIESRFQEALTRFYLADSYATIVIPPATPKGKELEAEWKKKFASLLEEARKGFEAIYVDHRREFVGLYAHLWLARCLGAQGEHRKAIGIYELLMDHQNREIERFQRDVFFFRLMLFSQRKEFVQVIEQGNAWLKSNVRFQREPSYLGVEMEVARAYLALGDAATDVKVKRQNYLEGDRLLERLARTPNPYTGLARREQLRIADVLNQGPQGRTFHARVSLANAKLDSLDPKASKESRAATLAEAARLYREAIAAAGPNDAIDGVNDARLALVYVLLEQEDLYSAATLAEFMARRYPKTTAAPQAASFAVKAFAWAYEQALELQQAGVPAAADVDAERLIAAANYLTERWPDSKEAVESRLIVGRLEYARRRFEQACKAFDSVDPKSPLYAQSVSLSGRSYWDWYRQSASSRGSGPSAGSGGSGQGVKPDTKLRDAALERLQKASGLLGKEKKGIDRERFLNDLSLGEVLFEAGQDDQSIAALQPLIDALAGNKVPTEIESAWRVEVLTTAMQALIRAGKMEQCDRLVELIGQQQGQQQSANVTQVFVALAARIKEQIDRLKGSGDEARRQRMVESFERFLDRLAQREAGQTMRSRIDIALNYAELGRHEKGVELLQRALAESEAADPANQLLVLRAKFQLASSYAATGDYKRAREVIDPLYLANRTAKDIVMKRGEILEAAGDWTPAILHWKDVIRRMQRLPAKPPEFYEAALHLASVGRRFKGDERKKRLGEARYVMGFILNTDPNVPTHYRSKLQAEADSIDKELSGTSAP